MTTEKFNNEDKNALVLEGIYKGIIGKIEEVRAEITKESSFATTQQVSAYESMMEGIRQGVDSLLTEFKFLSQQNSAIFENQESAVLSAKDEVLACVNERIDGALSEMNAKLDAVLEAIKAIPAVDYDLIAEKVDAKLNPPVEEAEAVEEIPEDNFDYDTLAEKIATILPEVDYDTIAEKVSAIIPEVNYDEIYERVSAANPAPDYDAIADQLAQAVPLIDYDLIAEKVSERIGAHSEEPTDAALALISDDSEEEAPVVETEPVEETVEEVVEEVPAPVAAEIDYDVLAQKVVSAMPENDYDKIAAIVAAGIIAQMPAKIDTDELKKEITDGVVEAMASDYDVTVDEESVTRLALAVTDQLDYNVIAERLAQLLQANDEDLEEIATEAEQAVVLEEEPVAEEPVVEETVEEVVEEPAEEAVEEPVEEPVAEEAETVEEPIAAAETEDEIAASVAVAEEAPVGVVETVDDPSLMLRLKRSFLAKIIQSDEDVKVYYGEIKNELLSYAKVRSQISWANDRFTKGRETLAKITVRGKTLCLYLALNPDAYPISVYHQKVASEKMYEKTPMMVKVKSGVALKRAIRLIESMMEREEGQKLEAFEPVDYAAMYEYEDDQKLLDEGLIKTTLIEKIDLNFD